MGIEKSEIVREVLEGLAQSTQICYRSTLKQFVEQFIHSREEERNVSIEDLVTEAKSDVTKTQERISNFYKWLQNEKIEGYPLRGKQIKSSSAYQKAYGYLLGFFVNLDIAFQKKWRKKIPKPERRQSLKKDKVYTFYDVDEKTMTIQFNRERMEQFLTNLKMRDVAITLALLATSQDSGDLFKLNVGDIREQNDKSRIFWEGYRGKSKVLFRTFISKEATKFIRRYLEQERQGAKDDEPLFTFEGYKQIKLPNGETERTPIGSQRMTGVNLCSTYRDAAKRTGMKWENGERNPLRPKRMRHLFRTACDTAGVNELYINAFMGHTNSQGQDYSELSKAKLELEYLRVEPFITVYGQIEETLEIKQEIQKLKTQLKTVEDVWFKRVESVAQDLFEKWKKETKDLIREEQEAIMDEEKWREQKRKELPEPSKEEIVHGKEKISKKSSKIPEEKKEKLTLEQLKKMSDEAFEAGDYKRVKELRIKILECESTQTKRKEVK